MTSGQWFRQAAENNQTCFHEGFFHLFSEVEQLPPKYCWTGVKPTFWAHLWAVTPCIWCDSNQHCRHVHVKSCKRTYLCCNGCFGKWPKAPRHTLGRILLAGIEGLVAYAGAPRPQPRFCSGAPAAPGWLSPSSLSCAGPSCTLGTLTWYSAKELLIWKQMKNRWKIDELWVP